MLNVFPGFPLNLLLYKRSFIRYNVFCFGDEGDGKTARRFAASRGLVQARRDAGFPDHSGASRVNSQRGRMPPVTGALSGRMYDE